MKLLISLILNIAFIINTNKSKILKIHPVFCLSVIEIINSHLPGVSGSLRVTIVPVYWLPQTHINSLWKYNHLVGIFPAWLSQCHGCFCYVHMRGSHVIYYKLSKFLSVLLWAIFHARSFEIHHREAMCPSIIIINIIMHYKDKYQRRQLFVLASLRNCE